MSPAQANSDARAGAIAQLARYLTGPLVAHHSMRLTNGSPYHQIAKDFFELREAMGVKGYMDTARAELAIAEAFHAKNDGQAALYRCLTTSPRFADMTVTAAVAELRANGMAP